MAMEVEVKGVRFGGGWMDEEGRRRKKPSKT